MLNWHLAFSFEYLGTFRRATISHMIALISTDLFCKVKKTFAERKSPRKKRFVLNSAPKMLQFSLMFKCRIFFFYFLGNGGH